MLSIFRFSLTRKIKYAYKSREDKLIRKKNVNHVTSGEKTLSEKVTIIIIIFIFFIIMISSELFFVSRVNKIIVHCFDVFSVIDKAFCIQLYLCPARNSHS